MKKYLVVLILIIFVACGGEKEKKRSAHNAPAPEDQKGVASISGAASEPGKGHSHNELRLTPDRQKEWGIVVATAERQSISSRITLPGVLALDQNKTAHISSFVQGKVISLAADLGSSVRKGQALVIINSPEFSKAQADFLEARARFNLSQKEYERAKMLLKEKAIEEKEYLRREAEYEKLSTEYGAYGSALHSFGLTHEHIEKLIEKCKSVENEKYKCEIADPKLSLLSPLSGTVIFRDVLVGEHVEPNKILFTVSDLSTLWALLDAYEKDLPFISLASRVSITLPLYPEKSFAGKITYVSDLIDEKSRTVKVRVEVGNPEGLLKPNMYIQGVLENEAQKQELLSVPEEAIQTLEGEKIIFIQQEDGDFVLRRVELDHQIGDQRIIAQGISPGERIVVKGAFKLKSELTKASFGEEHVH